MRINIDASAMRTYQRRLQGVHRAAFPNAVRDTLNNAAFDVKQSSMPDSVKRTFTERNKTFFKANSKVETARGFDVKSMKSTIGFVPNRGASIDKAVQDLEDQEHGGKIGGRSFITTPKARVSGGWAMMVRPAFRTTAINDIINAEKIPEVARNNRTGKRNRRGSAKQRYIRGAFVAQKKGSLLMGKQMLSKILSIKKTKSGALKIRKNDVYSYKKNRKVTVRKTSFMEKASMRSGQKLDEFFRKNAEKQINKYTNR